MPKAAFATLGCKVNQYETQRILDDFEERGFAITEFNQVADIYVINTCSVTQAAERKSQYMIRKVAKQNPAAIVVMTGCYSEMAKIKNESVDEVTLVVPNHRKLETLSIVMQTYPELNDQLLIDSLLPSALPPRHRTRATIKVQDGCNVFCSFCSIPFTRKYMYSRPIEELVAEAEKKASEGYKEIVITGVLVGAYGQDNFIPILGTEAPRFTRDSAPPDFDLAACLLRLAQVPGIERVRLSSIEPTQVTDRLLDAFASEPKLCRHLHIPLQSGDSGILSAMNRPYDQEFYLERCRTAKQRIPDLAITSDIMTGFPGEDEAAFENTLKVVREVGFARAHLFRYSPRPNTPAADFENQVPEKVKEDRATRLGEACRETQKRFIESYLGRELEVLVEGKDSAKGDSEDGATGNDAHERLNAIPSEKTGKGSLLSGYSSNYIRVQFTGGTHLCGTIARVRLIEPTASGAIGEAGGAHFGPLEAPPDADFIPLSTFHGEVGRAIY